MSPRHSTGSVPVRQRYAALRRSAPVFSALGDETRLRLVAVLCAGGAMSIAQLTTGMDITRQAVTKHLQVLADAGLVRDSRAGRERLWAFEPARIEQARHSLESIGRQWDRALEKLKMAVEDGKEPALAADGRAGGLSRPSVPGCLRSSCRPHGCPKTAWFWTLPLRLD